MSGTVAPLRKKATPAPKTEIVVVTPQMATQLLEHNQLNRPLRDNHVQRIARQIIEGKWKFNGDTIKIADTGDVLDGQHRLWAVIESKRTIETVLVRGVERDAFATIDTIRAPRSGGDTLALNGAERYRNIMASALGWLIRWNRGVLETYREPTNRIENSEIEAYFAENPRIISAVERAAKLRKVANPAIMGFVFYAAFNRNNPLADRMMDTLEDPTGVAISDPFFRLRSYFLADHHKVKDPIVSIAVCFKSLNAAYRAQKMQSLTWRNQGKSPEAFPKLEIG